MTNQINLKTFVLVQALVIGLLGGIFGAAMIAPFVAKTGPQGATGAAGSAGATGQTGATGATGATGQPGANGATWWNGTGTPAASLGSNGDFYLDLANGDVYNKVSGLWSKMANIQGATGATGPQGPPGSLEGLDLVPPVANAGQDQTANVGDSVILSGSGSSDNVGIVSYNWEFGDGSTGTQENSSHTYTEPGIYIATLTVKDAAGFTAVDIAIITVVSTIVRGNVSSTSSSSAYVSSISWSHSVGSGVNRILLVSFATYKFQSGSFPPDPSASSVTYNGVPLTKLRNDQHDWEEWPGGSYRKFRTEIWYLLNPPSGTYSVVVSFSTTAIADAGAVDYSGVSQSAPWNTSGGTQGTNPLTVSLTTTTAGCVIVTQTRADDGTPDHTELWNVNCGACGEKKCTVAGNYSVSWNGINIYQAMSAGALRPA